MISRLSVFFFWVGFTVAYAANTPLTVTLSGSPGIYTKAQWKKDWPGCAFEGGIAPGRVELVKKDSISALRVNFAPGQIGPEKGGAGWRFPLGTHEGAELRYTLRFSPNFEFIKGGKLPGLCGGPENVSGGRRADGANGFSARLMWRREGRGEAYIYHKNQPEDYGHSFPFPADFRFPTDKPVQVRLAVTMNQVGQKDGTLRVWITLPDQSEKLMVEQTDMEWRSVKTFGVDGLYFETFHGGGDTSWAPKKPCWAEFSALEVRPGK
ncbi:polysaccharide lyase [Prosthecobacter dejongeii]|uniref:Polysaccharide lyase 14 domain-containing protein n=1 Tax=Prosthecobacter dejongeii TaxID=48465 RepID=A0A7W8DNI0_9BACT|nr:hypothetical protein [Prosthecobacter dejongeii]MBB5035931.1 hypothetical protein [Prosthecobacter dejongeii]